MTPYRQCVVDYFPFIDGFTARKEARPSIALRCYNTSPSNASARRRLKVDWGRHRSRAEQALVNFAGDIDVALTDRRKAKALHQSTDPARRPAPRDPDRGTEMDLAKRTGDPPLQ